jgi:PTS system nitrogen regulatory IIA component
LINEGGKGLMNIMDFLSEKAISANLRSKNKKEVIEELADLLVKAGEIKDKEKIVKILFEREALGSTGIGQGIAIPHGKSDKVKKLVAALGISKQGIDFESLDGEPAYIFFLLVAPLDSAGPHLKALARISRLLKDKFFRDALKNAQTNEEILDIVRREDERRP